VKAQDDLASFLNTLGIAISYHDDPRLRDLHVLKPEWVTEGIYTIINAKTLAAKRGELGLEELAHILDTSKYPPESHEFLVELMRKFDLCFRFPEEERRYLIPELLDKQEPAKAVQNFPPERLTFEYRYPMELPPGLLPRFIVRTAALSVEEPRWRSGVFLTFEGNRALVQAAATDRTVRVSVAGSALGRRRLLAVIRADFEYIHRSYAFRPEEMVPVPDYPRLVIPYEKLLTLEQKHITTFQEVYGEDVLTLNVKSLLDGVDLEGIRPIRVEPERRTAMLSAFVSYSHKDDWLAAELTTHLKLLQRSGLINLWRDRCITAGSEWKGQIDENLEHANLILLLVSSDFIASDYCWDVEMLHAMERHNQGSARVIPIVVRACSWQRAPFGELQCLPPSSKAVNVGSGRAARDKAWTQVAQGIEAVLKELREAKSSGA
jgi:internalin A